MVNKKDKLEDRRDQEKDVTTLQNHLSHQMVNHQKKKTKHHFCDSNSHLMDGLLRES